MNAYSIPDHKDFTTHLFLRDTFDFFEMGTVSIQTFTNFEISGNLNLDYYDTQEQESLRQHNCTWSQLRPFCFQLIKGKKLPLSFKLVFYAAPKQQQQFISQLPDNLKSCIGHLSLTVLYKNHTLSCVTGIAYSQFTLDRSGEALWSSLVEQFFKKQQIAFTKQ